MENVFDLGRVTYVPAVPIKKLTVFEKFLFFCDLLVDILQVIVFSIPHWFIAIYRLVVSPAKKSVVGQTVLVRKQTFIDHNRKVKINCNTSNK